jgi:L-lactate dehydrogenase complex protein LldF
MAGRKGRIAALPLAGAWTQYRDFPGPQKMTFREQWNRRRT